MKKTQKGSGISWRPSRDAGHRLEDLATATERPKTYFLDKMVEAHLPMLEEKYKEELEALRRQRALEKPRTETNYPEPSSNHSVAALNETVSELAAEAKRRAAEARLKKYPAPPRTKKKPTV